MIIFTIGFTKKSAQTFFELIKNNNIENLLDIRLNNSSQLAGFSKGSDLEYFLKEICKCHYFYDDIFAPTKELMDNLKSKKITSPQFDSAYSLLMEERQAIVHFNNKYADHDHLCLLCSEDTPDICHRRTLSEIIASNYPNTIIKHL